MGLLNTFIQYYIFLVVTSYEVKLTLPSKYIWKAQLVALNFFLWV